jgi:hypothetical protein
VPVQGAEEEKSAFAGVWTGSYWSRAAGRHGTIRFTLPEHADTGYGEVEITFSPSLHLGREAAAADYPKAHPEELQPGGSTTIGITMVRIQRDRVQGTMAPYWDPDCECRAQTVFEGKLDATGIAGSFTIRREPADRRILTGEWRVEQER